MNFKQILKEEIESIGFPIVQRSFFENVDVQRGDFKEKILNTSLNITEKDYEGICEAYYDEYENGLTSEDFEEYKKDVYKLITNNFGFDNKGYIVGLNNFPSKIELFRIVELNNVKDLNTNFLGMSWTYNKNILNQLEFHNSVGFGKEKDWYLITGVFNRNDIDVFRTIYMLSVLDYSESEIVIKYDHNPIKYNIKKFIK